MKSILFSMMILTSFNIKAETNSNVRSLDVVFPCINGVADLKSISSMGIYTAERGLRIASYGGNQVSIEGMNLVIQSGEAKTVLGTLQQTPVCSYDADSNTYSSDIGVNVIASKSIQMLVSVEGDFSSCYPVGDGTGWIRDNFVKWQVIDPAVSRPYEMNWSVKYYFTQEELCKTVPLR